ncbi:MAG: class I SAM-dependent methyltransferase [Cyanobacteriota bacterium]
MTPPLPTPSCGAAGDDAGRDHDLLVQQVIPGYTSLARLAVALLAASPLGARQGARILVAGCGTGAELLEARHQRPDWQLTALDPSEAMLAAARARLGDQPGITWLASTVEALASPPSGAPDEAHDGAMAVLVLQALPDDGSKLAFLTALARQLKPGAQTLLVDLAEPERSPLQQQLRQARMGYQRASGLVVDPSSPPRLSEALHPVGASRLTALVEAAGFGDPARIFQALDVEGYLLQRRD